MTKSKILLQLFVGTLAVAPALRGARAFFYDFIKPSKRWGVASAFLQKSYLTGGNALINSGDIFSVFDAFVLRLTRFINRCLALAASNVMLLLYVSPDTDGAPVHLVEQQPLKITNPAPNEVLIDFGRVAFGNLLLIPPPNATGKVTVKFGEAFSDGRISSKPPGSVRYAETNVFLNGEKSLIVAPLANVLNTQQPRAVLTPGSWGIVLPFRWVELDGWPGMLSADQIRRRAAFASDWDDNAASFQSSDETLNKVWELCRYSIKATTFAGVFVDGDRERTSYEADAYLDQLDVYYTDGDVQMAQDTFDRLMMHPTWPTEWASYMIFMAYADWMQTGDTNWLFEHYSFLKSKLQLDWTRADGLVVSSDAQISKGDLVDWPPGERDGFVFTHVNTVVNAFHLRALALMAEIAHALHQDVDAADYNKRELAARAVFQKTFFDPARGLYRDGEGTDHVSIHANLFPLAFGLVPAENRAEIARWLCKRGMACSVYAAQYLLEGLFENGCVADALALITAPGDRSWKHMLDSGATITWEAWDVRYKPNLDWTHAWGAAPANLLPRFVLGAQPLAPSWRRVVICPNPGTLKWAEGKIPTPLGPIFIHWQRDGDFKLSLTLPSGMSSQIRLPADISANTFVNGKPARGHREGLYLILDEDVHGVSLIEIRKFAANP